MTTTTSTTSLVRLLQWVLAAVVLGLSAKTVQNKSSLTSLITEIDDFATDFNASSILTKRDQEEARPYILNSNWKPAVISLSSSALNLVSHPTLAITPKLFQTFSVSFLEMSVSKTEVSFSTSEMGYLSSVAGTEASLNVLYLASFIYQVAEYGSMNCEDIAELLLDYNVTSNDLSSELTASFFDYNVTSWLSDTTLGSNSNLTLTTDQIELVLTLSSNCQLKKGLIALSFLTWFTFLFTTGVVGSSALALYRAATAVEVLKENAQMWLTYSPAIMFPSLSYDDPDASKTAIGAVGSHESIEPPIAEDV